MEEVQSVVSMFKVMTPDLWEIYRNAVLSEGIMGVTSGSVLFAIIFYTFYRLRDVKFTAAEGAFIYFAIGLAVVAILVGLRMLIDVDYYTAVRLMESCR